MIILIRLLACAASIALTSICAAKELGFSQYRTESIPRILPGFWYGKALETPVGKMKYDILFHTCDDGTIAGVARTGASLHYWNFSKPDEGNRIRFLSTFAGNRTPTLLLPDVSDDISLNYFAPKQKLLSLMITPTETQIDIRVFHHDKPHVYIQLTRSDNPPDEIQPHHTRVNSCRGSPAE